MQFINADRAMREPKIISTQDWPCVHLKRGVTSLCRRMTIHSNSFYHWLTDPLAIDCLKWNPQWVPCLDIRKMDNVAT